MADVFSGRKVTICAHQTLRETTQLKSHTLKSQMSAVRMATGSGTMTFEEVKIQSYIKVESVHVAEPKKTA